MSSVDEITFNQILKIFTKRWKYLVILALVFVLAALVKHKYFPMYPGSGKLIIKDAKNSQLQMLLSSVASSNLESALDTKGDETTLRAKILLETHDFYYSLAERLYGMKGENEAFGLLFPDGTDENWVKQVASNRLSRLLSFSPSKGGVLVVSTKTSNKELTVLLINETLEEARQSLVNRELHDLNQAENYFEIEIENVKSRIENIENSTVSKLQKNQILSVDMEKGDSSKYISELKKNINDTKITIATNNSRIKSLREAMRKSGGESVGAISKFNESSQIKNLEDQNKELRIQLSTYQTHLRSYESQKTGLVPMQYEIQKMNAAHEFEYKIFVSLNDSLAKIGLQKTYVKNKIDILEKERLSRVHSSPSLVIMVLISLMLSQVIGIFSIYIYELFKPSKIRETL